MSYSVGQVAAFAGVTVRTLHHYDRTGLLSPMLFPRVAAVVHHAGAGTSAAALRAGAPSVPVPVTADQPFWAARLASIGAATEPIPFAKLTEERLAGALGRVVRQAYARAASVAARHMATEDGVGAVLKALG